MSNNAFRFDLGSLSLNFIATVGARGSDRPIERLATPGHFTRWLRLSGIIRKEDVLPLLDDVALAAAIETREVLNRITHDVVHHHPIAEADLIHVNAEARAAYPPVPQLGHDVGNIGLCILPIQHITLPQVIAMIACDAIDVLTGPDRALLRECAGPTCEGIYIDHSRGFRRRWCSGKTCGNKVRVERFRKLTISSSST